MGVLENLNKKAGLPVFVLFNGVELKPKCGQRLTLFIRNTIREIYTWVSMSQLYSRTCLKRLKDNLPFMLVKAWQSTDE